MQLPLEMTNTARQFFHVLARAHRNAGHPPGQAVELVPAHESEREFYRELTALGLMVEQNGVWKLTEDCIALIKAQFADGPARPVPCPTYPPQP